MQGPRAVGNHRYARDPWLLLGDGGVGGYTALHGRGITGITEGMFGNLGSLAVIPLGLIRIL